MRGRHLDAALTELADEGSRLTRALLGGDPTAEQRPAAPGMAFGPRLYRPRHSPGGGWYSIQ